MFDTTALVLIALLAAAFGFAAGFLISNLLSGRSGDKASGGPAPENAVEVARIWRDKLGGGLVLAMRNRVFRSPAGMRSAERDELLAAVVELRRWVLLPEQQVREEWSALELEREAVEPSKTSSGSASRASRPDAPRASSTSMVTEIDEILQARLAETGQTHRAIRLMELPGKGMVVMIGLDQYEGVDAVPDPAVRSLIRECVLEWERRTDGD